MRYQFNYEIPFLSIGKILQKHSCYLQVNCFSPGFFDQRIDRLLDPVVQKFISNIKIQLICYELVIGTKRKNKFFFDCGPKNSGYVRSLSSGDQCKVLKFKAIANAGADLKYFHAGIRQFF